MIVRKNPALMALVGLIVVVARQFNLTIAASGGSGSRLATAIQNPSVRFLDSSTCTDTWADQNDLSEASQLLLMLKCDIKPLYEQFAQATARRQPKRQVDLSWTPATS